MTKSLGSGNLKMSMVVLNTFEKMILNGRFSDDEIHSIMNNNYALFTVDVHELY